MTGLPAQLNQVWPVRWSSRSQKRSQLELRGTPPKADLWPPHACAHRHKYITFTWTWTNTCTKTKQNPKSLTFHPARRGQDGHMRRGGWLFSNFPIKLWTGHLLHALHTHTHTHTFGRWSKTPTSLHIYTHTYWVDEANSNEEAPRTLFFYPQQNLSSSIKITMWWQSFFLLVSDHEKTFTWKTFYVLQVKKTNYSQEPTYIHT